jgi:hypothetical protein
MISIFKNLFNFQKSEQIFEFVLFQVVIDRSQSGPETSLLSSVTRLLSTGLSKSNFDSMFPSLIAHFMTIRQFWMVAI